MEQIRIKRGDTLLRTVNLTQGGAPVSIVGATLACQIRSSSVRQLPFVASLTCAPTLLPGQFTISATAIQTSVWPIGQLNSDVQITIGATVMSTETFAVYVDQDVTT